MVCTIAHSTTIVTDENSKTIQWTYIHFLKQGRKSILSLPTSNFPRNLQAKRRRNGQWHNLTCTCCPCLLSQRHAALQTVEQSYHLWGSPSARKYGNNSWNSEAQATDTFTRKEAAGLSLPPQILFCDMAEKYFLGTYLISKKKHRRPLLNLNKNCMSTQHTEACVYECTHIYMGSHIYTTHTHVSIYIYVYIYAYIYACYACAHMCTMPGLGSAGYWTLGFTVLGRHSVLCVASQPFLSFIFIICYLNVYRWLELKVEARLNGTCPASLTIWAGSPENTPGGGKELSSDHHTCAVPHACPQL